MAAITREFLLTLKAENLTERFLPLITNAFETNWPPVLRRFLMKTETPWITAS